MLLSIDFIKEGVLNLSVCFSCVLPHNFPLDLLILFIIFPFDLKKRYLSKKKSSSEVGCMSFFQIEENRFLTYKLVIEAKGNILYSCISISFHISRYSSQNYLFYRWLMTNDYLLTYQTVYYFIFPVDIPVALVSDFPRCSRYLTSSLITCRSH